MRHYGFPVFFRLAAKTFFAAGGTFARLTPRRLFTMLVMVPVLFIGQFIHRLAFVLDDIFFSDYKKVVPVRPLFVVGIPRSGTTFLHRLLSEDTESFTTLTTWEMVLAPSIIERKLLMALGRLDAALGGYGERLVRRFEDRAFAAVRKIHHISLFEPEEDDIALFPIFASMFMLFPFPFPEQMDLHVYFDKRMPEPDRRAIMEFYRACVQRHLYVHGTHKRFLSKNPAFTSKIESLREFFPDCDLVCNVRSPYQAVPSLLSFVSFSWRRFDNDMKGTGFYEYMLSIVAHWYRYPMECEGRWSADRYKFIPYEQLRGARLEPTMTELYHRLGLTPSESYAARLRKEYERALKYKSEHTYDLAEYGLTPQRVLSEFQDVFERFGFDTSSPGQPPIESKHP